MSLLIKGVQVVDGAGSQPYKADVLIQKKIISAIGDLKRRRAQKEIDGLGNYLAPGFIDVAGSPDHYLTLFSDPAQSSSTSQGVPTVIGGQDGASLAPLIYGTLESIRKWADPGEVNVNWHTVAEFLKTLERVPLGVNFGTLVGHGTVRRVFVHGKNRRLTSKELAVFKKVLRDSLREGAFGFSSGLGYAHGRGALPAEMKTLVKETARSGGIYAARLRDIGEDLLASVKEIIKVAKETGAKTIVTGFRPTQGQEEQFEEALKLLEKSTAKASVYFALCPHPVTTTAIYTLLPQWAQKDDLETMLEIINDKKLSSQVKNEWQGLSVEKIKLVAAPHHPYLIGRKVTDADDLIELMIATGLRAAVECPDINQELLAGALTKSQALIASEGAMRDDTFPRYLELAIKSEKMPIERAIKKITSDAASCFDIKRRGRIKERSIADLVIIGKNDYEIKQTILGGKVVGEERARGEILRHKR